MYRSGSIVPSGHSASTVLCSLSLQHHAEERFLPNRGHSDVYATFSYIGVSLEGRRAIKRRRSHSSTSQMLTVCCAFLDGVLIISDIFRRRPELLPKLSHLSTQLSGT